jgi:hypothetical protein
MYKLFVVLDCRNNVECNIFEEGFCDSQVESH